MSTQFVPLSDSSNAVALQGQTDLPGAISALLTYWASINRPYSSGEVAACIREHLPTLRFSVLTVGEILREQFYAGSMLGYPDGNGGFMQPFQVPRFTEGLYPDRTPAGQQVFVYAPDDLSGQDHPFEVFIPKPGESQSDAPVQATPQTMLAAADSTGKTQTPIDIFGAKAAVDPNSITASVHKDRRLCITRAAFEAAVSLGGKAMRGGDPVWVTQNDSNLKVHLSDPNDPTAVVYSLVPDRGRIRVTSQDVKNPFQSGTVYRVVVGAGIITVNIG